MAHFLSRFHVKFFVELLTRLVKQAGFFMTGLEDRTSKVVSVCQVWERACDHAQLKANA
jgi:hypothetical protein